MLFYEPLFLFVFLPAIILVAWRSRHRGARARTWTLLVGSILFYTWGEPRFVPVVIASSAIDYGLARPIARRVRAALVFALVANFSILVFYKYLGFISDNLVALGSVLGIPSPAVRPDVALPIGVSFIVFEKATYLVDVWRGLTPPSRRFVDYLAYVFFFPKLLAGPIIKYHEINMQFADPAPMDVEALLNGTARFMLGMVKKVLLADTLAPLADRAFALPPTEVGFLTAWSGVLLFTLQIYLDFSAYSDMAIGLARAFGFRLNENFDRPYVSCSMTEFWRRWHISLTSWIREYLYIPLGGNRVPPARRNANLWICFLASGLWHGAAWTYVCWGAYNGFFLVLDRLILIRVLDRLPRLVANALTMLVVMVGWTIFRSTSLTQLGAFLHAMIDPGLRGGGLRWENTTRLASAAGIAVSVIPRFRSYDTVLGWVMVHPARRFFLEGSGAILFAIALDKAVTDPFRPFLYFRF